MNVRFVLNFEQILIIPQSYSAKHEQSFSRKSIRFFEFGLGATKQTAARRSTVRFIVSPVLKFQLALESSRSIARQPISWR